MGMGAAQNTETVLYGKVCGLGVEDLSLQGTKCAGHDFIITAIKEIAAVIGHYCIN